MSNEELIKQIKAEPDNKDLIYMLYENNLPVIKKIILPYTEQEPLEDLLQQSYFGILEALKRYEPDKGYKFMTYAGNWIKQSVQRYIEECGRTIRLPAHFYQSIREYRKYYAVYYQEHGKAPTKRECAKALKLPEATIDEIMLQIQPIRSIDETIETDTDNLTIGDIVASDEDIETDSIDRIYTEYQQLTIWDICEQHTPGRSLDILKARFQDRKTYKQIADEMGVTIERVRQLEQKALRKLGMGKAKRELQEKLYIEDSKRYGTGLDNYIHHDFTSSVERRVINKENILEELRNKYREKIPYIDEVI